MTKYNLDNKKQSTTMKNVYQSTLLLLLILSVLFVQCKKSSDTPVTPDVIADSSSISSLIVSCKSSDASATGFAVIDIQQFFLTKRLVSSTAKGKIFSVKLVNESDFKATIDKVILDLQVPESYFKNYDSFLSIIEDRFKTKTGYQKAYDINQSQIEQFFNKQGVLLAIQGSGFKNAFLKNMVFASAGLGTLRLLAPLSETFTLNRFQGLMTVGRRISGTLSSNQTIKNFFGSGAFRSTSITKDDQVVYIPFFDGNSTMNMPFFDGNSYSYYYPLPPSPAPVFDAPVWYWHQFTTGGTTGANIAFLPPNAFTTTWTTAEDRYKAIRLKAQQVVGATVVDPGSLLGAPGTVVTDAEVAYIVYSANFTQRYKDQTVTLWIALNDKKRESYQIAFYPTGYLNILKFVNASVTNGNYIGDPAWSIGWNK